MPSNGKFAQVSVESDTRILAESQLHIAEYDALYQVWFGDGIQAESLVFLTDELGPLDDAQLEMLVRASPTVQKDSKCTIKRDDDGFTFVKFNFRT